MPVVGTAMEVNAELPGPSAFASTSQVVGEDDIEDQIPYGAYVQSVTKISRHIGP